MIRSPRHAITARSWARILAAAGATVSLGAAMAASAPGASAAVWYTTPAITVAGGNTVIAVQTSGDGLRFYWNQYGTNTWRGERVALDGTVFSAPTIAQNGNSVVIAAQGPRNDLDFYWQQNDTTPWHPELVAAPGTTYSDPAITANDGSVNVVAQGPQLDPQFF